MRPALALLALPLCGCFATTGDLEGAVADISERIAVVARSAEESAGAARDAWKRGEIDYAELEKRLADIRAATLDVADETAREVIDGVRETIRERPGAVVQAGTGILAGTVPPPWGEILTVGVGSLLAYGAASRKSKSDAERVSMERDINRARRGERV